MRLINWRFFFTTLAVDLPLDEIVDELKDFDERFGIILRKHLAVLGWWCFINLLIGLPGMFLLEGWLWYFMLMNMSWAVINFAIVLMIFDHIFYQKFVDGNTFQRFEVQRHVEKMLLLNIGLDTAYIFAGLYLYTLGNLPDIAHPELWTGFGISVVVQGIFLFCHDNFFHFLHYKNFKKARPFMEDLLESQLAYRQRKQERVGEQ